MSQDKWDKLLLKDPKKHTQCKFCRRILPTRAWADHNITSCQILYPGSIEYEKKKWKNVIEENGFCTDCQGFAKRIDQVLGGNPPDPKETKKA